MKISTTTYSYKPESKQIGLLNNELEQNEKVNLSATDMAKQFNMSEAEVKQLYFELD